MGNNVLFYLFFNYHPFLLEFLTSIHDLRKFRNFFFSSESRLYVFIIYLIFSSLLTSLLNGIRNLAIISLQCITISSPTSAQISVISPTSSTNLFSSNRFSSLNPKGYSFHSKVKIASKSLPMTATNVLYQFLNPSLKISSCVFFVNT
eukprot:NODE_164_length_16443_cov_0.166544.p9 type:complete len:148 gc:universal NODE_164_length_16443_cov_0.166544:5904-6347(+)